MKEIMLVLLFILGVLLIAIILMQKPEREGFIEAFGGNTEREENIKYKVRGTERVIIIITYIIGFTLMALLLLNYAAF